MDVAQLADLLKESARFYRTFQPSAIRVTLLEGRERILPELPESLERFSFPQGEAWREQAHEVHFVQQ